MLKENVPEKRAYIAESWATCTLQGGSDSDSNVLHYDSTVGSNSPGTLQRMHVQ